MKDIENQTAINMSMYIGYGQKEYFGLCIDYVNGRLRCRYFLS